jgi:C-terminal processing protease CtpA/Prc
LPDEFQKWVAKLNTNRIKGIVLDLRYAEGENYNAAAQIADQFAKPGEPLLTIGTNQISASEKTKIDLPIAALANKQTRGAAEALAALVRETGAGLIIGSGTAGEARVFETFTLSTGQRLKIGTIPIEVGTNKLPSKGLMPDLAVAINPSSERIFYQDPFRSISPLTGQVLASTNEVAAAGTNRTRRFMNEAELVRRHRTGASLDEPGGPLEGPDQPVINDPVLARALDFLKGISALQQHR